MLHADNIIKIIGNIFNKEINNSNMTNDIYIKILNQRRYTRIIQGKGWKNKGI